VADDRRQRDGPRWEKCVGIGGSIMPTSRLLADYVQTSQAFLITILFWNRKKLTI